MLAACSEPDPNERTLVEVIQPTPDTNYGVFVWRQKRAPNPTLVYFGLAPFQNDERDFDAQLDEVQPFGVADFAASQIQYGWSDLKDFSVCAAKFKKLKTRESSVFTAVMDSVNFTSAAECADELYTSFPPSVGSEPKE